MNLLPGLYLGESLTRVQPGTRAKYLHMALMGIPLITKGNVCHFICSLAIYFLASMLCGLSLNVQRPHKENFPWPLSRTSLCSLSLLVIYYEIIYLVNWYIVCLPQLKYKLQASCLLCSLLPSPGPRTEGMDQYLETEMRKGRKAVLYSQTLWVAISAPPPPAVWSWTHYQNHLFLSCAMYKRNHSNPYSMRSLWGLNELILAMFSKNATDTANAP